MTSFFIGNGDADRFGISRQPHGTTSAIDRTNMPFECP
jgi:hypothetical protein